MSANAVEQKTLRSLSPRYWIGLIFTYLLVSLSLIISGGDLDWWQAWVYSLLVFAAGIAGRMLAERRHPGLMAERVNLKNLPGVISWDKVLSPLMSVSVGFPLFIVAGFDHRYGWSSPFPIWLNVLGLFISALGYGLAVWALIENRFFSGMVRIQEDRGHVVCNTGPYRLIRHPGYAGNILALPGIVLASGSLWTLIPAAVALVIAVVRTTLEDRFLQAQLPGYCSYASRVRYRLFPWIY